MIDKKDTELKLGQTRPNMKVCIKTGISTVSVLSIGLIIRSILENSITIILRAKVRILGLTAISLRENGNTIRCMVQVPSNGQMVDIILESTKTTKSRAMVNFVGPMAVVTEVYGAMESKKARASISLPRVRRN
jgi:hypothetical protein